MRTKNIHPKTHTRLPRYARGKVGVVEMCHGCHMSPDSVATDQGDNPQWLYTVVFDSRELWGPDADPTLKISIDAFEPYLDPASERAVMTSSIPPRRAAPPRPCRAFPATPKGRCSASRGRRRRSR